MQTLGLGVQYLRQVATLSYSLSSASIHAFYGPFHNKLQVLVDCNFNAKSYGKYKDSRSLY